MKNLSPAVRLLLWAIIGILVGAAVAAVIVFGFNSETADSVCFYIGIAALIVGLFAGLKGTPGSTGIADKEGNTVYYNSSVAMEEEASSKAMQKHYHDNHVIDFNAFSTCVTLAGIAMAIISHLSIKGTI